MSDSPETGSESSRPLDALESRIPGRADELVISELTAQLERTRHLLQGDPEAVAMRALDRIGGQSKTEARIAAQMAGREPLAEPEHFLAAHRLVMHALEVLDREGSRDAGGPRWGPLSGIGEPLVEMVTSYIVKSYAEGIIGSLRRLYARREAQSADATPERRMLARARVEADRLAPGYSGGAISGTALVLGGVAVPGLASLGQYVGAFDFTNRFLLFAILGVLLVLFLALSSVLLRGAAVARRRSRLIMSQPLAALWETIGNAGSPPEDDSVMIASVAITITGVLWLVGPLIATGIVLATR